MEKPITIKVLMIHGYGQSGPLLDIKTSRLQHALQEAFTNQPQTCEVRFCFPSAPCRILVPSLRDPKESSTGGQLDSLDMWTWCMDYSLGGNKFFNENKTISDLDDALDSISEIIQQHGPFNGVIGFSSGACIAALIASLLEEGRKQAFEKWESKNGMPYPNSFLREGKSDGKQSVLQSPLKFAVCYSGFSLKHPKYSAFYQPQIKTPTLHVLGKWDTVVEEQQSLSDLSYALGGWSGRTERRTGKHVDGNRDRWKPEIMAIKAVIQFVKATERLQAQQRIEMEGEGVQRGSSGWRRTRRRRRRRQQCWKSQARSVATEEFLSSETTANTLNN